MASEVLRRPVAATEQYPHVHQDRRCGQRGCAACGDTAAGSDDLAAVRVGNGGHRCAPAGRGTTGRNWTCGECGADWIVVYATRAGVKTGTWERA